MPKTKWPPWGPPVNEFPPHRALEEAGTAVAGEDAVVLSGAGVAADDADQAGGALFRGKAPGRRRGPRRLHQRLRALEA